MNYDDFGAPLPDGLEDRRHYAPGCYPYRNAEERDRYIAQMTTEYAHLPQIDARSDFFLLPPASKTAQEIGAKPLRSSFHTGSRITGKRFATANGFARTKQEKGCGIDTGKDSPGKLSPSSKKGEQQMLGLAELRLLAEATSKMGRVLLEVAQGCAFTTVRARRFNEATQALDELACQK